MERIRQKKGREGRNGRGLGRKRKGRAGNGEDYAEKEKGEQEMKRARQKIGGRAGMTLTAHNWPIVVI